MPISAVLFDIGGTLWSSPPEDPDALARCYGRGREVLFGVRDDVPEASVLAEAVEGFFADWEERWRLDPALVEQRPTTAFVAEALEGLGLRVDGEALEAFTDALLETSIYTAKTLAPEPGMPEALAALKERGLKLGAFSNAFLGARHLQAILDVRGLGQYLDVTLASCEIGWRKPHPRVYEEGLRHLGARPEESVYVGDRIDADVIGPASIGMRTVLTHQYRQEHADGARIQPDAVIRHLRDLPAAIEQISRLP